MNNKSLIFLTIVFVTLAGCKKEETDKLLANLSTSKAAYEAAANGTWIEITSTEYNSLASSLSNVTRSGTNEADYITASTGAFETNPSAWTIAQDDGNTIPTGSLLFAVKINTATASSTGAKVKISSTSSSAGFSDVGTALPTHAIGEHYFLIKGNTTETTATGYLGYYKPNGSTIMRNSILGKGAYKFESGDANTLTGTYTDIVFLYQGLSTTTKQW